MTPKEFQEKHGFDDEDIERIKMVCKKFNGQVVSVEDTRPSPQTAFKNILKELVK